MLTSTPATKKNLTATNFDLPSLHLLRSELEVTLHDAETHLSEFNDDDSQAALLLDSVETLRQVANVLKLISLEGADKLAKALADGFQYLYDNRGQDENELVMDISEGIMTLGRYIEFVLLKETVEPSLLLPIINTLYQKLGKPNLTLQDLTQQTAKSLVIANPEQSFHSLAELGINDDKLVEAYRAGLFVALSAKTTPTDPSDLQKLQAMAAATTAISQRSDSLFWQSATAAVTDLATSLPLNITQKRALIFVEQQFNNYLPVNDSRFADLVSFASQRNHSLATHIQQQLAKRQATDNEHKIMKQFLFGPNREVVETLNHIIQEEIDQIKTASDSYARQENISNNPEAITTIVDKLKNLSSVFKTLNLTQVSHTLAQQANAVQNWSQPTPQDFDSLLTALMGAENASIGLAKSHTPGATNFITNQQISLHQLDTAYNTLITESRATISTIETALHDYIADSTKDMLHLVNIPEMMQHISGAAQFLGLPQSAHLLKRTSLHMSKLLENAQTGIAESQLAKIADVMVAVDYYLESLEVNKPAGKQAIKIGQKSLHQLMAA